MRVDAKQHTMDLSLLYVGAVGSGKRCNIDCLAEIYGPDAGPVMQVFGEEEEEQSAPGAYLELKLGRIAGFETRADCFTVDPASLDKMEGASLLRGADVLILVIDSRPEHMHRNHEMLRALTRALGQQNRTLEDVPLVFQWNHQDAAGAVPSCTLALELNPRCTGGVSALARDGAGVWETHTRALRAALSAVWLRATAQQPPRREGPRKAVSA